MRQVDHVTVAVIQAASKIMDQEGSTHKACELIAQAAEHQSQLIVFPEAFIAGYPRGLFFDTCVGSRGAHGKTDWARYWRSAVTIPGDTIQRIGKAARYAQAYVALGVIEQDGGTLYCTTLYYGPDGALLGKHRKIKPTGVERLIWGEGDGSTLTVLDTPFGKMGGLICWENYMPLARTYMYGKGVSLYLAPTADSRENWQCTIRHIACEGRCFVLAANQYVEKAMYPVDLACYDELKTQHEIMCRGGSAIINPFGEYVAGPLYEKEGILFASLDLTQIEQSHFEFDVVGSYARPDIFTLLVNDQPQHSVQQTSIEDAEF